MKNPTGLSSENVKELQSQYGLNVIEDKNKATWQKILLRQFTDNKVIYLLLAAAIVSLYVNEVFTSVTILMVVILVIVVGFIQEYRAEQAVQALRKMAKSFTRVYRDGKIIQIESSLLVPGDCVVLRGGDVVPADSVIIEGRTLHVNESALTGESQEAVKDSFNSLLDGTTDYSSAQDSQRLYMGTSVLKGKCKAMVTHIGMNTKLGGIAHLISSSEKQIILTAKINRIINFMIGIATIIGLASAGLLLLRADGLTSVVIVEALILFIALAVSAFPEDLPVVMMATLTAGARRMAQKNAIVNRLGIIETLGEVSVICSDKTGTLTKGQMTVREIITDANRYHFSGSGFSKEGTISIHGNKAHPHPGSSLFLFLKSALLCSDTTINPTRDDTEYEIVGSTTEGALLIAGHKGSLHKDDFEYEVIDEHPFDSDRKCMSVVVKEGMHTNMYSKGAPEVLLHHSSYIMGSGDIQPLTETGKRHLMQINEYLGRDGMRTIACAYKPIIHGHSTNDEHGLVFLGIAALEDTPHDEVPAAISACHTAGIVVKMITGDQPATAHAIGRQIGLVGSMLTANELDNLSDEELRIRVKDTAIFARVRPEHKYRIVQALKQNGEVVAMTGDGVNDAPALKEAHVGIAMGKNGTEVTRSVADITLCDDNFATIVSAIHEGRVIFKNIRKFVGFQLSCNMAELITGFIAILVGPFLGWTIPLITSIQILFMNLITDNVPAIALGQTSGDPYIMHEKPRRNGGAAILSPSMIAYIAGLAITMCSFTLVLQYIGLSVLKLHPEVARSTTMVGFIIIQVVNSFQLRSFRKGVLTESPRRNVNLIYAAFVSIGATLLVLYTPLHIMFETTPIGVTSWALIISAAFVYLLYVDIIKYIYNLMTKRTHLAKIR